GPCCDRGSVPRGALARRACLHGSECARLHPRASGRRDGHLRRLQRCDLSGKDPELGLRHRPALHRRPLVQHGVLALSVPAYLTRNFGGLEAYLIREEAMDIPRPRRLGRHTRLVVGAALFMVALAFWYVSAPELRMLSTLAFFVFAGCDLLFIAG